MQAVWRTDEICDNALDDDSDGLTDLNDSDCICKEARPVSLIPNPSFEEKNCCPEDRSQLDCAKTWIQASEATTDYLHSCGWMGWTALPPPVPFPDGNAVVGFRNGRYASNKVPNWKEYAGACLNAPMKPGTTYLIRFYIGFTRPENSPPLDIVFYGTSDCKYLPFGVGNPDYGCPTNGPGWTELGRVFAGGQNEWQLKEIRITPQTDIHAMAIGPDCLPVNTSFDTYYFLDHLVLADQKSFEQVISPMGNLCSDTFTLQTLNVPGRKYQWYKQGIALLGENRHQLRIKTGEGDYQVRITDETGECVVTPVFLYRKPFSKSIQQALLCPGTTFTFHSQKLNQPGEYQEILRTREGCDSIVLLQLESGIRLQDTVIRKVFPEEWFEAAGKRLKAPGIYPLALKSSKGCDSLVLLKLDIYKVFFPTAFSPNGDGVNDRFNLFGEQDLKAIRKLRIFDRWGGMVFEDQDFLPGATSGWDGTVHGKPAPSGQYPYAGTLVMNDGKERQFKGVVQLVR